MTNQEYQKAKYDLFKTYKKPTSDQVDFMRLMDLTEKTKEEDKLLKALTKKFKAYDDFLAQKKSVDAITHAEHTNIPAQPLFCSYSRVVSKRH